MPMQKLDPALVALVEAALPHVAFDGWSDTAFQAALRDTGLSAEHAKTLAPKGAADLAVAFHRMGDAAMVAALKSADLTQLRYSEKVAYAIRARIDAIPDKEAVRRGVALFALPHMAAEGAKLIWGTADLIWDTLGDRSDDINWYTKRATLSGVYASSVLFWLGDTTPGAEATTEFIARRIDDVMRIEKVKAQVNASPFLKPLTNALAQATSRVRPPPRMPPADLPGYWSPPPRDS
jgi:ubiquinone biosynthesis protein COQ9